MNRRIMSVSTVVLLAALVLCGGPSRGESVKCWACTSAADAKCGNPFSSDERTELKTVECTMCGKTIVEVNDKVQSIVRLCLVKADGIVEENKCVVQNLGLGKTTNCACTSDHCNGAEKSVGVVGPVSILGLLLVSKLTFDLVHRL